MGKLTKEQVAEMVRLREGKGRLKPPVLARRFNCSTSAVNYQLLRHGVDPWDQEQPYDPARRGAFSPEEDARMLALGASGMPTHKIAIAMKRPKTSLLIRLLTLEVRAEKKLEKAA